MERLYAQFDGGVWIDISEVVAACPGEFVYGKASFVPDGKDFLLGGRGRISSVMVARDENLRLYDVLVVAGGVTCRAVQVVSDRDGALGRLIRGL